MAKLTLEIKNIKSELKSDYDRENKIEKLKYFKRKRYEAYFAVQKCRSENFTLNQELYFKRMALRYKNQIAKKEEEEKSTTSSNKKKQEGSFHHKLTHETRGVYNASECRLEESPGDFAFSGTDNGIVNMSTTTPFDYKRYKFHLKLYNRYQLLKETEIELGEDSAEKNYLDLPQKQIINSTDVDVGCLHAKFRRKLERAKKKSMEGNEVLKAEALLSKSPLSTTNTSLVDY